MPATKMFFDYAYDYDNNKILVKVYDHGDDWQIVSDRGERWYTKHMYSGMNDWSSLMYATDKYTSEFKLTCITFEHHECSSN